jgi:hypothetical protein
MHGSVMIGSNKVNRVIVKSTFWKSTFLKSTFEVYILEVGILEVNILEVDILEVDILEVDIETWNHLVSQFFCRTFNFHLPDMDSDDSIHMYNAYKRRRLLCNCYNGIKRACLEGVNRWVKNANNDQFCNRKKLVKNLKNRTLLNACLCCPPPPISGPKHL